MRGGLRTAAFAVLIAIGGAPNAFACRPSLPIQPRETPFLAMLAHASAIVKGRVIEKRDLPLTARETITYVDIEVRKALAGTSSGTKLRVWSDIGLRTTCPTHNLLATIAVGDDGIFAIRTVPIDQRLRFQVEHDIRTLIVTHAIARPDGEARMLGIRHHNACPFGCVYFESARLDALRTKVRAQKSP